MTISQDSSAPLIVVVGATGAQGGSVVKNLAESDKPYRIRGITRDSAKAKAQELANKGVELVQMEACTKDEVFKAFEGATYAFVSFHVLDCKVLSSSRASDIIGSHGPRSSYLEGTGELTRSVAIGTVKHRAHRHPPIDAGTHRW